MATSMFAKARKRLRQAAKHLEIDPDVLEKLKYPQETLAYELLKAALYDGRVDMPENETLLGELLSLEVDAKTEKIDHQPNGTKDLADALAGVVYGLAMRREVWHQHQVIPYEVAPQLFRQAQQPPDGADAALNAVV